MNQAGTYRQKAAEFRAKAADASEPFTKAQFERLAVAYLHLAERADKNAQNDIFYEANGRDDGDNN